ncbi:MAG TPA: class I SAM-dependent methyltransferase [Candidatus Merdivicinus faecavium]|nr:class I SAM-dependent methyltransferase [Candidatus Merdivicinus faecavium]
MRIASDWAGYEMIDTSGGEKLERWGEVVLIRPDPQIIWNTPRENPLWRQAHARYFRSEKGGGHWENYRKAPAFWELAYKDLTFKISPTGFKHTGLFPEQAVNWDLFRRLIAGAGRPVSVLNLFAYTGGATLACAAAGATVCHVDASKGMVAWAKENAALSGLSDRPVRWIVDDCEKFVAREIRRGRRYDAIIMDPPSYGRGPGGEVWKLEESVYGLVDLCAGVLSERPLFVALNSYTTGLSPSVMAYLLGATVGKRFGGSVSADEIGLPVTGTGLALPCGSTALWTEQPLETC